ncbi:MAG: alpha/beta hydrolase-fold protein [Cyclobacteriaceae bacterium]|jgi:enterochelin esterase-like enzyme
MKFFSYLIACAIFGMLMPNFLMSQDQSLIKKHIIPATNDHDTIRFGLMIPPSYNENGRNYPVLYYLHGLNGHYADWKAQKVAEFCTINMKDEVIPEYLVVFPDGGEGFWCNHYDGDPLLEDEIIKYLIPYIDQNYPTDQGERLIMGWSAGGAGTMVLFSKHPKLFKGAFSLDASIMGPEDFQQFQGQRPDIFNSSDYYYEYCSPNEWMSRNREMILEKQDTALFITAAFLAPYHQDLLSILKAEGIPFYYKELACEHQFDCVFQGTSNDLLSFLSKSFE